MINENISNPSAVADAYLKVSPAEREHLEQLLKEVEDFLKGPGNKIEASRRSVVTSPQSITEGGGGSTLLIIAHTVV